VVDGENEGRDISILYVLLLLIFRKHDAGISSKLKTFMRFDIEDNRSSQVQIMQIFCEELIIARGSKFKF
jgi:hypothetical protein